jgi:hypothetical protein
VGLALSCSDCADEGGSPTPAANNVTNNPSDVGGGDVTTDEDTSPDAPNPDVTADVEPDTAENGEICGNGADDNGNILIDEACRCDLGTTQGCWTGTPGRRGVGACTDGVQTCIASGDVTFWGLCEGGIGPSVEVPLNGIDEDCDGVDAQECQDAERGTGCYNGLNEDCDEFTDCEDPDCTKHCGECTPYEEVCEGGLDEDCDGLTDCADPDCASSAACNPNDPGNCVPQFPFVIEIWCANGLDDDCDGLADCDDPNCHLPGQCGCATVETVCGDNINEDCDSYTDCGDEDCESCSPGTTRWCDEPTACHWGSQECGADGNWGTCYETANRPGSCDSTFFDLQCCLSAGGCCQNWPEDQRSLGNCPMVNLCEN